MARRARMIRAASPYKTTVSVSYGAGMDAFTVGGGDDALDYTAAGTGRRAATWRSSAAGPNASLTYSHATLVNRSRDAVRKNPYADHAASVIETNAVGTGIKPQFRTPDDGLNKELAALWLDWTDEADADARLDWYGLQALGVRSMFEAGEVFGRFRVRRPGEMNTVPLQVQLLESEFCPLNENRSVPGRDIRNGIEFDVLGRRTAYWMYRQHPNDWAVVGGFSDGTTHPVPASEVMHVYEVRRPGAIRGEPWLTRALVKLRDLDGFDDATLVRAKVSQLVAGFITSPSPDETGWEGDDDTAHPDAEGNADVTWEPGTMAKLGPGEEVSFSTPAEVGSTYDPFMRQQLRAVAVATRVLYEQLTGDYSQVNDRTFRASVNEFRRSIEALQHNVLVFQLCRPVIERWLDLAVTSGLIRVPSIFRPRDLYRVAWLAPRWPYIHPVQDVQADEAEVRAGFASRSQKVSERGYDAEELDRQNAEDNARADDLGVAYTSDGRRPKSGGGAATTPANDDGGDAAEQQGQAR